MSAIDAAFKHYRREVGSDLQTMMQLEIAARAFRAGWKASYGKKPEGKTRTLEEAERAAQYAAREVSKHCPTGWGFLLVMAAFGEGGSMTYTSDLEREDAWQLMEELLERWKGEEVPDEDRQTLSPRLEEVCEALALLSSMITSHGMTLALTPEGLANIGVDVKDEAEVQRVSAEVLTTMRKLLGRSEELCRRYIPQFFNDEEVEG